MSLFLSQLGRANRCVHASLLFIFDNKRQYLKALHQSVRPFELDVPLYVRICYAIGIDFQAQESQTKSPDHLSP